MRMNTFCSQAYTAGGLKTLKVKSERKDYFTYYFKGYPDALKRELLSAVSDYAKCETAYDFGGRPISLVCDEKGFRIFDGTYPQTREPETYGITDAIINLGGYQSFPLPDIARKKAAVLFEEIRKAEKRCTGYISAAKGVADDCRRLEKNNISFPSVNRFMSALWKKYGTPPVGRVGKEVRFFADVPTADGMYFPFSKFGEYCKCVSVISDFSSALAESTADKIRLYAISCGYDVITFVDFLDGETVRHVIIPELEYGIYSERLTPASEIENTKRIRKSRFLSREYNEKYKNRAAFCKRAYSELIEEAEKSIKDIQNLKNQLDEIFFSATDCGRFIDDNLAEIRKI